MEEVEDVVSNVTFFVNGKKVRTPKIIMLYCSFTADYIEES